VIPAIDSAGLRERMDSWRSDVDRELAAIAGGIEDRGPVADALRYALDAGGKRLRPILCLAAADALAPVWDRPGGGAPGSGAAGSDAPAAAGSGAAGSDAPAAAGVAAARVRAAAAIEMVHTYSLVHDDLPCMDNDDLRRGRPTTHRVFGTVPAMLAGFALIPLACRVLSEATSALGLPVEDRLRAVRELCRAAGAAGMVGGQVLDLEAEGRHPDADQLIQIHGMKTGALFRAALRIGGVLGGADTAAMNALDGYGAQLGLAFQVTDDVLDVTTDAAILGKTPGKDVDAGKVTFVSLYGVPGARAAAVEHAGAAAACLRNAGITSPLLEALAGFAVDRDR
jgi:geranylgeranyl pyrophosphate synthase